MYIECLGFESEFICPNQKTETGTQELFCKLCQFTHSSFLKEFLEVSHKGVSQYISPSLWRE